MIGAREASRHTAAILKGNGRHELACREYIDFVEGSTGVFWHLIRSYYTHSFRELFLNGTGPLNVHGAIISILAGHVFPRPPWALALAALALRLLPNRQHAGSAGRRRKRFSLLDAAPQELPQIESAQNMAAA
jgi:hypothetical protein